MINFILAILAIAHRISETVFPSTPGQPSYELLATRTDSHARRNIADGPISNLKDDLLYHIFFSITSECNVLQAPVPSILLLVPWRLAAVCSRWRALCLGMPALWTKFQHTCHGKDKHLRHLVLITDAALLRCNLQLQRSSPLPIDIRYHVCEHHTGRSCGGTKILMALSNHAGRWRRIEYVPFRKAPRDVLSLVYRPGYPYTSLEQLDYYCNLTGPLGPLFTAPSLPALKALTLNRWNGDMYLGKEQPRVPNFPWTQIRQLSLQDCICDHPALRRLLRACHHNLTHLALQSSEGLASVSNPPRRTDADQVALDMVFLDQVIQIEIDFAGYKRIAGTRGPDFKLLGIIRLLYAPKLETLVIKSCDDLCSQADTSVPDDDEDTPRSDSPSADDALRELIRRSDCHLRSLDLTKSWSSIPLFFTDISPDLEELRLWKDDSDSSSSFAQEAASLLGRMIPAGTSDSIGDTSSTGVGGMLFPRLKLLQIRGLETDAEFLAQVIHSRQELSESSQGLERVEVDCNEPEREYDHESVEQVLGGILSNVGVDLQRCELVFDPRDFKTPFRLNKY